MNTKDLPRGERKLLKRAQRRWVRVLSRIDSSSRGRAWTREFIRFEYARKRAVRASGVLEAPDKERGL